MRNVVFVLCCAAAVAQERPGAIAGLSDVDGRVRLAAAREFWTRDHASAGVIEALAELRHDAQDGIRAAALLALARVGRTDLAAPHLEAGLLAEGVDARRWTWEALLACGPEGVAVLRRLVRDPAMRGPVLASLDVLGEVEVESVRGSLLFDRSWMVRRAVAADGASRPAPLGAELSGLLECARGDPSSAVRLAAIDTLGRWIDDHESIRATLRAAQADPDPRIRLAVLRGVPRDAGAFDSVARIALDDAHPGIVVEAILALRGRPAGHLERLRGLLGVDRPEIATAAALVLVEAGERDASALALLVAALGRSRVAPPWQRRNLRAGAGAPPFEVPVRDPADSAVRVLTHLGAGVVGPILDYAKSARASARLQCVHALAGVGEAARGALDQLAADPDAEVAAAARRALEWLEDPESAEEE